MKNYKKYQDIPEKYRFDLEYLLEGKTVEEVLNQWDSFVATLIENKEKQYESIEEFLKYKKAEEKFGIYFGKIYNYISNKRNTNLVDPEINKFFGELMMKYSQLQASLGSEENRFFKHINKIQSWLKDERIIPYKKSIEATIEAKKYKLDDAIEDYLTSISQGEISLSDTFGILRDSETQFKPAISEDNKKYPLTVATYSKLLKNKDEKVRRTAFENFRQGYFDHKQTFASLLNQHFKHKSAIAKSRGFTSLVEAETHSDKSGEKLLDIVFKSIQSKSHLFYKFKQANKKFFKFKYNKAMKMWDSSLPLVQVKEDYSVEEAQELLFKAVEPLGQEYLSKVKEAIEQRWVDYYNVRNKRTGAYSIGAHYGLDKKFILMNFDGTLRSVSTLAHEMGHSMHSYYSDKNQPYSLASYPIFLAEIASIFNELMLNDYLLKNNTNKKIKFSLLENSISDFLSTVVRQAQWANYEYEVYKSIDEGKFFNSYESFEAKYVEVLRKYMFKPETLKIGDKSNIYSVTVPHYYYGFYVYKYSIGYIVANVFFQKYKENGIEALQDYIEKFLSKGGSDWPIELLKNAGVDLYDETIYEKAFKVLEDKINAYVKLGNEIFKK